MSAALCWNLKSAMGWMGILLSLCQNHRTFTNFINFINFIIIAAAASTTTATTTSECEVLENNSGVTTESCQQCLNGYQYWPCNTVYCNSACYN